MTWLKNTYNYIKAKIRQFWRTITTVALVSAAGATGVMMLTPEQPVEATHYYQASWEWVCEEDFCYWQAPGGNALGLVDLRSIPQMSKAGGTPEGFGVFAYEAEQNIRGATKFESKQEATDFIWQKLTVEADPTGQTGPKPLRGRMGKEVALYLAGEKVKAEPFNEEHRARTIAVFQADYERNVKEYPAETVQKWVGATMQELYGRMDDALAREIVPQKYRAEERLWRKPETTITESWNCSDSDSLDCDLTWTEDGDSGFDIDIVSNKAQLKADNRDSFARAEFDLSSDDHYAQGDFEYLNQTNARGGVIVRRKNDSSQNLYAYRAKDVATGNTHQLWKEIDGTFNLLDGVDGNEIPSGTVYLEVDGDSLVGKVDGVQRVSATDTTHTGFFRTGIYLRGDPDSVKVDNFEAADLGGAEEPAVDSQIIQWE